MTLYDQLKTTFPLGIQHVDYLGDLDYQSDTGTWGWVEKFGGWTKVWNSMRILVLSGKVRFRHEEEDGRVMNGIAVIDLLADDWGNPVDAFIEVM